MLKSAPLSTLRLVAIPRLAAGGRWRVEAMRSLSEPCLLWFTKGQGRITISGVTRGYTAHNAVFIPAGVMHGFEAGSQVFGTAVFFGRDPKVALPKVPLHLRIREGGGSRARMALSFPLPLTLAAWALRLAQPFVPQLRDTGVDDLIIALRHSTAEGQPLVVDVQDDETGERVEIYIG